MDNSRVVHGFYFDNDKDYQLALKDEEMLKYLWKRIEASDKRTVYELYCKLLESNKCSTVVGMAYIKEIYNYIIQNGYATEDEMPPIEGFTVEKLHRAGGYSQAQMHRIKMAMEKNLETRVEKYKNNISRLKITVGVLIILVVTLFSLGFMNNDGSNYVSARENVIDEYSKWESELTVKEKELKEREEKVLEEEEQLEQQKKDLQVNNK